VDLRGRTTLSKSKSKLTDLGIKKLSHSYLDIKKDGLIIASNNELQDIIKDYEKEGASNLYIVRLLVQWKSGQMQEWTRTVLHVKDKQTNRMIANGRWNALVLKLGEHSAVTQLQEKYGIELVQPTLCETIDQAKGKKRVCLAVMK